MHSLFKIRKRKIILTENINTIIGEGTIIEGIIKTDSIIIEGRVVGEIYADEIYIKEEGHVDGNIESKMILVEGIFNGTYKSQNKEQNNRQYQAAH